MKRTELLRSFFENQHRQWRDRTSSLLHGTVKILVKGTREERPVEPAEKKNGSADKPVYRPKRD